MLTKQEKNELNIKSLRKMLKDQPMTDVETLAMAIYNITSSVQLIIEKPNDGELMQAILSNLDSVSKDMHKLIFKDEE